MFGIAAVLLTAAGVETAFRTHSVPGMVAAIATPLAVAGALAFFVVRRVRAWWLNRRWLDGIEMRTIDRMTGSEFEHTCGEIFRRFGYKVEVTQQTRDQGADLLMNGREGRVVVQTKRQGWQGRQRRCARDRCSEGVLWCRACHRADQQHVFCVRGCVGQSKRRWPHGAPQLGGAAGEGDEAAGRKRRRRHPGGVRADGHKRNRLTPRVSGAVRSAHPQFA
ncbi:MAG: restriction endonuclease [Alphaproteobacteria bacterium]|nr:restriction endonuclease [Alphaproteobacteria bacterium]